MDGNPGGTATGADAGSAGTSQRGRADAIACRAIARTTGSDAGLIRLTSRDIAGLLCPFHHLIAIHRWGWQFRLNPDATTTVTSPDGRIFHTHSPPASWAA